LENHISEKRAVPLLLLKVKKPAEKKIRK